MEEAKTSLNDLRVVDIYKRAWEVVKKNFKQLALITLIGVAISTIVSSLLVVLILESVFNDLSGIMYALVIGLVATILAAIFAGVLQVVAIKKAAEKQEIVIGNVIKESLGYLPRALAYGAFLMLLAILAFGVVARIAVSVPALGVLLFIGLFAAMLYLYIKYAFTYFLIFEKKPMQFFERFSVSDKMTKGIYKILVFVFLLGVVLSFAGSIIASILSAPFADTAPKNNNTSINITFDNENPEESIQKIFDDAVEESNKTELSANYFLEQFIVQSISWGISLVITAAFLELYIKRKAEQKI